ncbi:hypothetical protein KM043_009439 [Ampulex compressa]|nr:hypothetical protein KM043_009439 [Ampulex compressa]
MVKPRDSSVGAERREWKFNIRRFSEERLQPGIEDPPVSSASAPFVASQDEAVHPPFVESERALIYQSSSLGTSTSCSERREIRGDNRGFTSKSGREFP